VAAALESYVSESVAFLVVAGLLALLLSFVARRVGAPRALGPVELLARLPLEARRAVYVVRVVDRVLIIGSSEAGLTKLGELPKHALGPDGLERIETPFSRLLEGVWRGSRRATSAGNVVSGSTSAAAGVAEPPHDTAARTRGPDSEED
jgi:flagellar protein FliO/FliZ